MIAKLVAYGFNKNMLSYIYSYINSRKQCFSINNVKSTFKERISGVSTSSHQRCSVKKVFSEVSRNSQENTFSRVSFFIKLQAQACNLIKKETLAQVFFCEFCKISKNIFFTEHLRWQLLVIKCDYFNILPTYQEEVKTANTKLTYFVFLNMQQLCIFIF